MVLRALPPDYAPGDTPTATQMNGLKDHAGNNLDRYTTVLRRGTLVQAIAHNAFVAINWQTVVSGYNGLGWAVGTPSRITIPSGADGRYSVKFAGQFAAAAGGFRYSALAKNGAVAKPGVFTPSDGTLVAWLSTSWGVQVVAGDYLEVWVYQNKTSVGTLNLDVYQDSPEVEIMRTEL